MNPLEQGDVIVVDFTPALGHEPAKRRPAVVVTDSSFNRRSSLVGVLPITSADNGYPLHVPVECKDVSGFACVEQARNIDLVRRGYELVGAAPEESMRQIMGLIRGMYGIW